MTFREILDGLSDIPWIVKEVIHYQWQRLRRRWLWNQEKELEALREQLWKLQARMGKRN